MNAPRFVAEQLALQQILGERGAILGDEQLVAPSRTIVNRGGDELLARARLALDQHADARVDDFVELSNSSSHARGRRR